MVIYNQQSDYSASFLNNILCGFRKARSTQHGTFKLHQLWKHVLDTGGFIGIILTDLSNNYDCIPHNLLIAKLECHGVDKASLKLLLDYLNRRKQRTKICSSFSTWCGINRGAPQWSTLGPPLCDVFINITYFFSIRKLEVCNFCR